MPKQERAAVDVVMPEVKLTVSDLAYMTGLLPGGVRCGASCKTSDKLVFLGLIVMGEVPPCPDLVNKFRVADLEARTFVKLAIKENRWPDVWKMANDRSYFSNREPQGKKDYVLTKSGLEFMAKGRARSMPSAKGGCL
jgi:hypothetical protein